MNEWKAHALELDPCEGGDFVRALERERQRIAAELHDGLCQELIAIGCAVKGLQRLLAKQDNPLASHMKRITKSLSQAAAYTRQVAHGMSNFMGPGDHYHLIEALRELAETVTERHGIRCQFRCMSEVSVSDPEVSLQLYRIAQEAIYNAATHSGGTAIDAELSRAGSELRFAVRDNGCGLKPAALNSSGIGLRAMKYRAALIGGELAVATRESGGAEVLCRVPLGECGGRCSSKSEMV